MRTHRQRAQALLDRFSFSAALASFEPGLVVDSGTPYPRRHRVRCVLLLTFPDRVTGEPFTTRNAIHIDPDDPGGARRLVFEALAARLRHESGEAVRFDGELYADPHARPRVWPWRAIDRQT